MAASEETVNQAAEWRGAEPSRPLAIFALVSISVVILASIFWRPSPVSASGDYFTLCGFKNMTGLPCPGCGLTHSFCALAKGSFADAFAFNLLGPPSFILLILLWVRSIAVLRQRLEPVAAFDRFMERHRVVKRMALAYGVFGAARILFVLALRFDLIHNSPVARFASQVFG
jgi:hypothetical protein